MILESGGIQNETSQLANSKSNFLIFAPPPLNVDLKKSLIRIITQEQLYIEPPLSVSYFLSYDGPNQRQAPPLYEHPSVKSMSMSLCLSVKLVHFCVPPCVFLYPQRCPFLYLPPIGTRDNGWGQGAQLPQLCCDFSVFVRILIWRYPLIRHRYVFWISLCNFVTKVG